MSVHFSEISTYLKCQKLHEYQYLMKITPRRTASQIAFGTFGHMAIETMLRGGSDDDAREAVDKIAMDTENRTFGEAREEHWATAKEAAEVGIRAAHLILDRFKPLFIDGFPVIEYPLRTVVEGVEFVGTPDCVLEDTRDGGLWIWDNKFRGTFRTPESEILNLQMIYYQGLLKYQYGIDVAGSRQYQIKPLLPKTPEITKTGKISKKDILSDWDTYSAFVKSQGEDPNDFIEMKEKLDAHVFFDFETTKTYRTPHEVETVWHNTILPVGKIVQKRYNDYTYSARCFNFLNCNLCSLKNYCIADMKGEDLDFLMKTQYMKKGEDPFFDIEIEEDE